MRHWALGERLGRCCCRGREAMTRLQVSQARLGQRDVVREEGAVLAWHQRWVENVHLQADGTAGPHQSSNWGWLSGAATARCGHLSSHQRRETPGVSQRLRGLKPEWKRQNPGPGRACGRVLAQSWALTQRSLALPPSLPCRTNTGVPQPQGDKGSSPRGRGYILSLTR